MHERNLWSQARTICATAIALWSISLHSSSLSAANHHFLWGVHGFSVAPAPATDGWMVMARSRGKVASSLAVSTDPIPSTGALCSDDDNDDDVPSDDQLLRLVKKKQLVELCRQHSLDTKGTKAELLKRLRAYSTAQAAMDRQRRLERRSRVEEGAGAEGKERYEIVSEPEAEDLEQDEDEGFFFFAMPHATEKEQPKSKQKPTYLTNSDITAPPPPPMQPDENGERVVTVYSTKDQNDLTGVAAAQPGQNAFSNDVMMTGAAATSSSAPWDIKDAPVKAEATSKELEEAKETVSELVHALLTLTGAPAFREEFCEGLSPLSERREEFPRTTSTTAQSFVGFDPSSVPTDILVAASQALRAGRGTVLQDVLREFELRAIGHDGMAGDDVGKGGGHYREVSKVRAFLEGYRRAEVRRVARETTTLLLDKLVSEGIEGLDLLLASMSKSSDDTGSAGELNDSLIEYLNDAIRQQRKKVEQCLALETVKEDVANLEAEKGDKGDATSLLWNVTSEDGQRVETLDPNDPEVRKVVTEEYARYEEGAPESVEPTPKSASEKLLLLLTLLRERIKAEAAFSNDDKGSNLRLLAYCLKVGTAAEREDLIAKQVSQSIDRLDSFLELVSSSIEYAESTSHQLQPSKRRPLNVTLLKSIHSLVGRIREKQAWRASGVTRNQKS